MIQVPEEIKQLCQKDSIAKNFRVSFPNGEYRDLTNSDMVAESVVFTESVNSSNGLKFGLCEGASLEFQTFFNYNIRNLRIKAEIEIDVTDLGAEITTINNVGVYTKELDQGQYIKFKGYHAISYRLILNGYEGETLRTITVDENFPDDEVQYTYADLLEIFGDAGYTIDSAITISLSVLTAEETPYPIKIRVLYVPLSIDCIASDDVEFPYYPILYGYFYVDSCKRDGYNNIRTIVAYQNKWDIYGNSDFIKISEDEKAKMRTALYYAQESSVQPYTFEITKFLCSCLNSTKILGDNVEKELMSVRLSNPTTFYSDPPGKLFEFKPNNLPADKVEFYIQTSARNLNFCTYAYDNTFITDLNKLYEIDYTDIIDVKKAINEMIINYITTSGFYAVNPDASDEEILEQFNIPIERIYELAAAFIYTENALYSTGSGQSIVATKDDEVGRMTDKLSNSGADKSLILYPYMSQFYDITIAQVQNMMRLYFPIYLRPMVKIYVAGSSSPVIRYYDQATVREMEDARIYKITVPEDFSISLPRKYERTIENHRIYSATYVADDTQLKYLDVKTISDSLVELQGGFLKLNRYTSDFEVVNLFGMRGLYPASDLYPLPRDPEDEALYPQTPQHLITRGLWKSLWYDDKLSNGYDRVCCNWKNANGEEMYKEVIIVDVEAEGYYERDYQHYDISNNYFISTQGLLTEEQVDEILENLGRILKNIQYYVANIDMRGLPFLEAGDSVSIITQDSGFSTFALRHRLSGIHALFDSIEAR